MGTDLEQSMKVKSVKIVELFWLKIRMVIKMREIKFRAWDKDMKMVIYPKKYYSPKYTEGWIGELYNPKENEYHNISNDDERFKLMQFTGLEDKNGKDIYESDIVYIGDSILHPVEFIGGLFGVQLLEGFFPLRNYMCIPTTIEVRGNIYENSGKTEEANNGN